MPDAPYPALDLAFIGQTWQPQTFHTRRPGDTAALCGQTETRWNTVLRQVVNCPGCVAEIEKRLAARAAK